MSVGGDWVNNDNFTAGTSTVNFTGQPASGDGVDQDDMVAFLGLHNAGLALGGTLGNAPSSLRADKVSVQGTQLRFVNCPVAPFLDSNEQSPCDGK